MAYARITKAQRKQIDTLTQALVIALRGDDGRHPFMDLAVHITSDLHALMVEMAGPGDLYADHDLRPGLNRHLAPEEVELSDLLPPKQSTPAVRNPSEPDSHV